jgi:hypothetical protein
LWDAWLLAVAVGMTALGVFMALFNRSALFAGFDAHIDPVFWGAGPIDPAAGEFQGWAYGVWGATVAGFGLLAAWVVRGPFRARLRWGRDALAASLAVWFLLDTSISAAYGVWLNVAFNCAVLAALTVPLAATWKSFASAGGSNSLG